MIAIGLSTCQVSSLAASPMLEPIQACVIERQVVLDNGVRSHIATCLGWQTDPQYPLCHGFYQPIETQALANSDEIQLLADNVSFYQQGWSKLSGHVEVRQTARIITAPTAMVYRDPNTKEVNKIELVDGVRYIEPGRVMIAQKAVVNPDDGSGYIENVLYRFNSNRSGAILPAWGRASMIERFANKDYLLKKSTYSTCAPQDKAWHIEADTIALDQANTTGTAKNAKLVIRDVPVFYTPYLSFPTSNERKSGFLMPTAGYSNVGGFDFSIPYYWNMAPNYDATITPHVYAMRGVMIGSEFRYLTSNSNGILTGSFLPDDRAFKQFILDNQNEFPILAGQSTNRWSMRFFDVTNLTQNLTLHVDYQHVSDNYYLQDFTSSLSLLTERQLLRQGDLTYTTPHWVFQGMVQSYQTLQPVNETPVGDIYKRLPQLSAQGTYDDLPFNANLNILGQFDNYQWPNDFVPMPEGPRYYLNPILSFPFIRPWGFITPAIQLVQNYYEVRGSGSLADHNYSRSIPRYSVDSGLYFDRFTTLFNEAYTQTLEPRLYYLYVPYHNQTAIPVYDSAYMIFNTDQLFRTNRFSGFDRIGDTNQITYALSTRLISDRSGREKASFTIGQIRYFADRRVPLCQSITGVCFDNPYTLGFLSPIATTSPLATRAIYRFNPSWSVVGDYVWNGADNNTNNANVAFQYEPAVNHIVSLGYTYLVNGDITQISISKPQANALHQASVAYAWPFNDHWSSLGAYSYNISKDYDMMALLGVQYDSCCWAFR